jgi:hypothetical protein
LADLVAPLSLTTSWEDDEGIVSLLAAKLKLKWRRMADKR